MRLAAVLLLVQVQWSLGDSAGGGRALHLPGPGMMPQLTGLDVKCARSGMTVHLEFDQVFSGVIYSKGHFYDPACNYVTTHTSGRQKYSFNVPIDNCGTTGQLDRATRNQDTYFENTIIIQNDALIQEEWDIARAIRCTWRHTIQKSVDFIPFKVYEPLKVPVQLDSRSINTLMEIQHGSGPFANPATGYVYMGDDTSVVIYIQDPSHEMDANVISCNASSAGGTVVELVDSHGCIKRPELLTQFAKTRNTNGVEADLMLYSYLKAFRIGESPEFLISCHLEVCEGSCSEPCSGGLYPSRKKRQEPSSTPPSAVVELQKDVVVISREQLTGSEMCWVDSTLLMVIAGLSCVVFTLSTLSCFLVHKVNVLHSQSLGKFTF